MAAVIVLGPFVLIGMWLDDDSGTQSRTTSGICAEIYDDNRATISMDKSTYVDNCVESRRAIAKLNN